MKRSRTSSGGEPRPKKTNNGPGTDSEEEMDLVSSQLMLEDEVQALTKNSIKSEAECGVIDKITLINFMCHRRLDIALSPNVNFVLGRNGSGKSAIMTGIVVGLGGNARNTERGKSLKQFIRSGERTSEVRVTLRNRGMDAYHHKKYGDAIIVERVINNDGTGAYRIKSNSGKTISTKKEELINILDHCGIQVDNPVSLLNQDTSRHFLQKSKPGDKYKLFMKATRLEQIASDYERAEQDQEIMKEAISRQRELLPQYEAEAKTLEEKVESFRRLTGLEDKVDRLKEELEWAMVAELEKSIAPIELDIRKEKNRIPRNSKKMSEAEEGVVMRESEESRAQEQLDQVMTEANNLTSERDTLSTENRKIDRSIRDLKSKVRGLVGQIREKEREKEMLVTSRDNCIAMSQRDRSGERELREKQLQDCQAKLDRLEGEISVAENDRKQFDLAMKRGQERLSELRKRMTAETSTLTKSEEQLERLRSSHNNRLAMFGRNMQELVDTIQRNRERFSHVPVGPLGSSIKLRDYTWATAVEQVIKKSLLQSFVADNHVDADLLRKMIRNIYKQGPRPEVIVSRFSANVYDVRRYKPEVDYPTVFDMLDVRDPNVLNVLIDQLHVESILLIANREEASRVIVHQRPRGAMSAYTREGDQVLQYAHYSNKYGKLGILRESVEAAVRDERARLDELRQVLRELQREASEVEAKIRRDDGCVRDACTKVTRKMLEKRKVKAAMEELQNAQEEEEPEEDIATYDSEIAELEDLIKDLREQRHKLELDVEQANSERMESFQQYRLITEKVDEVAHKIAKFKTEMSDFAHKKREAEQMVKYYQGRINTIQENVNDLESKIAQQKKRLESAVRMAEEVCPRVETERSRQSITSEIQKLERCLERERPARAEQERIEKLYMEAIEKYKSTHKIIKDEQKALEKLKESLTCRKDKYIALQGRITCRTQIFFTHFLQQRDYEGGIRFNHSKQRLEVEVKVDRHTNKSVSTKNTKALSGGERSFTTVCFIMSLWEAMEAPFRCLDEFDVFMDMMNRRISMKLMLEHAEDQPHRQFIFFTPQDMSSMGIKFTSNKVKVLKLDPPERGQTTLNVRSEN